MGQQVSSTIDHMLRHIHREGVIVRRCGRAANRAGRRNDSCQPLQDSVGYTRRSDLCPRRVYVMGGHAAYRCDRIFA
jgi:hypothetical protein